MERFWCLYRHRAKTGNLHQQDPAIFYVHFPAYTGLPYYYLHGIGILEKYAEIYQGRETEPVVLPLVLGVRC